MEKKLTIDEFIAKNNYKKEIVKKEYDTSELKRNNGLDCSIDTMISFCNKAKKDLFLKENVRFREKWTGYEDCGIVLEYDEAETDEEFKERIDNLYDSYLISYNNMLEAKRELEYKEKLDALNKKYGVELTVTNLKIKHHER